MRGELGVPVFGRGALSPWDVGPFGSVYFSPQKQALASLEPNFWNHSLQIHCNGPGPKTETLQIHLSFISKITIMTAPLIGCQVTSNDKIDLLRPMLNVHESHYRRTAEIIMR